MLNSWLGCAVSIGSAMKAAWTRFAADFRHGFERGLAESIAQPAPDRNLSAAFQAFFDSEAYKSALSGVVRGAFADGVAAERTRTSEILNAPGAATFLEIAVDLALGDATGAQAAAVLARAEADAATLAGAIKSNILDRASSQVTLH
jgi:hypothetical protein